MRDEARKKAGDRKGKALSVREPAIPCVSGINQGSSMLKFQKEVNVQKLLLAL